MRRAIGIAVVLAALAAAAGALAYRLRGKPRTLDAAPLELSPAQPPAYVPASDEPLVRETRFDVGLQEEEERRHEAAERLRADPLNERLDDGV